MKWQPVTCKNKTISGNQLLWPGARFIMGLNEDASGLMGMHETDIYEIFFLQGGNQPKDFAIYYTYIKMLWKTLCPFTVL